MKRSRVPVTVSLPSNLAESFDKLAKAESKNKSQLFRDMLSVYEQRGDYQLYVEHLEPVGLGALQLAFEQLKKKLDAEGLFAAERKKPLPVLPRRIGIITSPAGARSARAPRS